MGARVRAQERRAQGAAVLVDLSPHFNNDGISYASNPADGSFNLWGSTYPAEELPPSLSTVDIDGVPFRFPPKEDGRLNNVLCAGQLVEVPPAVYDWLYLLAASERRTEDWVYLHYASGAVDPEWLRVSDWWPEAPARFGEVVAFRASVLHYPRHVQAGMRPTIWRQRVPVTRHEVLMTVRLPDNASMHIFAATLVPPPNGTRER